MPAEAKKDEERVVIKKYPNRRLYNTETSVYVTLEDLAQLVKDERDFIVQDAKTGEDLTRQVLTQIIVEMETRGNPMLPAHFLRSVIRLYDGATQNVLQHYLDASMQTFLNNQEKINTYAARALQGFSPLSQLEELARQNVTFFEKTFSMFNPFGTYLAGAEKPAKEEKAEKEEKTEKKKR